MVSKVQDLLTVSSQVIELEIVALKISVPTFTIVLPHLVRKRPMSVFAKAFGIEFGSLPRQR